MTRVIVVGAGSAGCVMAARLSENSAVEVTLIEAGPDHTGADARALQSGDWMNAANIERAFDATSSARRHPLAPPRPYRRGVGIGGSSNVNGMIAVPGLPGDYDRWVQEFGLSDWSWDRVGPRFARLRAELARTEAENLTDLDRAVLGSAGVLGLSEGIDTFEPGDGSGRYWLHLDQRGRRSSRRAYLEPALGRPNLTVRALTRVERLLVTGNAVTGVVLLDGHTEPADLVVLCAGAIESPALLLRSGIRRPGIGRNLQDHPTFSVRLRLRPSAGLEPGAPSTSTVLRAPAAVGSSAIHFIPVQSARLAGEHHDARLLVMLMRADSRGTVGLAPTASTTVVNQRMLATGGDRSLLDEAISALLKVLDAPEVADKVVGAYLDEHDTPVEALLDSEFRERWFPAALRGSHAASTLRMGDAADPSAVVDSDGRVHGFDGIVVADASIMPALPTANPHLPVVMVAERLAERARNTM